MIELLIPLVLFYLHWDQDFSNEATMLDHHVSSWANSGQTYIY